MSVGRNMKSYGIDDINGVKSNRAFEQMHNIYDIFNTAVIIVLSVRET